MPYVSTRGQSAPIGFLDATLAGLAPDGGLYVPAGWPKLRPYLADDAGRLGFEGAAAEALFLFGEGDFSFAGAAEIAQRVYGPDGRFAHAAVTPLKELGPGRWILELFHGPSLAFKDVALQLIGALFEEALAARSERLTVVCATSGDTGGAAAEALKGAERSDLFILLPAGRVSPVQQRFMTATGAANVHALLVDGDFDACQALVKQLFADRAFVSEAKLSGVNSINWARIVAQTAYYLRSSFMLGQKAPVSYVVPSGNFGDALAGLVAKRMGAPIGRILAAANANDMLAATLNTGRHQRAAHSKATLSPAMDIQVASNFERAVYDALAGDGAKTARLYAQFAQSGGYDLPAEAFAALKTDLSAIAISDAETEAAMRAAFAETGEVLCPHTAVGYAAMLKAGAGEGWAPQGPVVLLATAHPAKFPETVSRVLGFDPPLPAHAKNLFERPEVFDAIPCEINAVKAVIRAKSRAAAR